MLLEQAKASESGELLLVAQEGKVETTTSSMPQRIVRRRAMVSATPQGTTAISKRAGAEIDPYGPIPLLPEDWRPAVDCHTQAELEAAVAASKIAILHSSDEFNLDRPGYALLVSGHASVSNGGMIRTVGGESLIVEEGGFAVVGAKPPDHQSIFSHAPERLNPDSCAVRGGTVWLASGGIKLQGPALVHASGGGVDYDVGWMRPTRDRAILFLSGSAVFRAERQSAKAGLAVTLELRDQARAFVNSEASVKAFDSSMIVLDANAGSQAVYVTANDRARVYLNSPFARVSAHDEAWVSGGNAANGVIDLFDAAALERLDCKKAKVVCHPKKDGEHYVKLGKVRRGVTVIKAVV